jgi:hypothetical protein
VARFAGLGAFRVFLGMMGAFGGFGLGTDAREGAAAAVMSFQRFALLEHEAPGPIFEQSHGPSGTSCKIETWFSKRGCSAVNRVTHGIAYAVLHQVCDHLDLKDEQ